MIWALNGAMLAAWFLYWSAKMGYWDVLPLVVGVGGTTLILWSLSRVSRYWKRGERSSETKESPQLKYSLRGLLLVAIAAPPMLALIFFSRQHWSVAMIPSIVICTAFVAAWYWHIERPTP